MSRPDFSRTCSRLQPAREVQALRLGLAIPRYGTVQPKVWAVADESVLLFSDCGDGSGALCPLREGCDGEKFFVGAG